MPRKRLLLLLLSMLFAVFTVGAQSTPTPHLETASSIAVSTVGAQITPMPHLELAVDASTVPVGAQITLRIVYVNVGMPHTTVAVDPPRLVHFDPPLAQPCKWGQHPTNCTAITFRADAPGTVTFRAAATGEIRDDVCSCWRWGNASDDGAVTVTISGTHTFLPLVSRP